MTTHWTPARSPTMKSTPTWNWNGTQCSPGQALLCAGVARPQHGSRHRMLVVDRPLDLAVAGLRRGECEIAVCGGVNVIHNPRNHIVFTQAGMLSRGRCKTFDDSADGYARSEGCGVLILKRYSDAKRSGDQILALIRGTAVRQDGESGGLTVPNSVAQVAVMRAALHNAALDPSDVQYVEAHGTGTSLGDPIEMRSIAGVFGESHSSEIPVFVASLKTNVGHMEAAAGIGGVIKTALQLRAGQFYPHLHMDTPSQHIPWVKYPVTVPTQVTPWQAPVRRAIVNSFGFAGTIASAVLEQAPARQETAPSAQANDDTTEVLVLSAKARRPCAYRSTNTSITCAHTPNYPSATLPTQPRSAARTLITGSPVSARPSTSWPTH